MNRIAILVALLAVACGNQAVPTDGRVCIDPSLDPEQAEMVLDAIDMWRDDSGGRVTIEAVMGTTDTRDDCDTDVRAVSLGGATQVAYTDRRPTVAPRIRVDFAGIAARAPYYAPGYGAAAIAHELGHAMGAEHSDDSCDLMHAVLTNQRRATPADVAQVVP
jgi:hypothetical protein